MGFSHTLCTVCVRPRSMMAFAVILLAIFFSPETSGITSGLPCWKAERGDTFDCICSETYCDTFQLPGMLSPESFYVYTSSASSDRFDLRQTPLGILSDTDWDFSMTVSPDSASQEILGFGGALTDASGYNLHKLPSSAQTNFLDSYFSKNGIEYSFVRVPFGGTDFSLRRYTNMNAEKKFNVTEEDRLYKIPYVQEILKRNENVRFLGSSWLAPEWMTYKDKLGMDTMNPKYYRLWAEYHKSFLDMYKELGVKFWGATTGNEIVMGVFSMPWSMEEHQIWINEHLGPVLENSGYGDLKLLFLDDQTSYIVPFMRLFSNNTTKKYIDGAALHWYADEKAYLLLDAFHEYFPDKLILNTESSICKYEKNYEEKLGWYGAELYAQNIIEKLNSYSSGWIDWNLCLDLDGGPNYRNNTCTAAIIVNAERGEFYKGPIFYAMGHFSKFIPPGSKHVDSTIQPEWRYLVGTAFTVEDRPWDIAVVLLNKWEKKVAVRVCIDDGYCGVIQMPARSIVTAIAKTDKKTKGKTVAN